MIPGAPVWVQVVLALCGAAGVGGVVSRLIDRWWVHKRDSRKQTDDMALHSNAAWEARVVKVEADCTALRAEIKAERETCERNMSELRHQLANEVMSWEALATGIKFRPDSAPDVLAHVEALRARRREESLQERRLRLAEARHVERAAIREERQLRGSDARVMESAERDAA